MSSSTTRDRVNGKAARGQEAPSTNRGNGRRAPSINGGNGEAKGQAVPSINGPNGSAASPPPSSGDPQLDRLVAAANRASLLVPLLTNTANTAAPPSINGDNGAAPPSINGDNGAAPPSTNGPNGRDEQGRFTKGNAGGPGNPFARRTAALRRALCESVGEEDVKAVGQRLLYEALQGDVASARLLLSYVIGRPAEAVDPDTLHLKEWQLYQQLPIDPGQLTGILLGVPANAACDFVRASLPILAQVVLRKFQEGLRPEAGQGVLVPPAGEAAAE